MENWIDILKWVLSTVLGGGIASTFIFFRSKKRIEVANADKAENDVQSQSIDNKSKCYKAQDDIIDDLFEKVKDLTEKFLKLTEDNLKFKLRIGELEILAKNNETQITKLTNDSCIVPDCKLRKPSIISTVECNNCKNK